MTRGDIRTEVLVRLNKDTTTAWTEANFNDWINQSHKWAAGYKKWPFTEGRGSTTYATEENSYFENWKSDTIRFIKVGGYRYQKINFEDYQIFREEYPSSNDRVFTDFARIYYINPASSPTGTIEAWGQYTPADIGDGDANDLLETVFSGEDEGNQSVINKVLSYAYKKLEDFQKADYYHKLATDDLNKLWERVGAEQHAYHSKDRGMWSRIDVVDGFTEDEVFRRDQF